jgi:Flp pilus assembly CpaF family ATPase
MVRREATRCRYCQSDLPPDTSRAKDLRVSEPRAGKTVESVPSFSANNELIDERAKILCSKIRNENLQADEFDSRKYIRELVNSDSSPLTMMERGLLLQRVLDEIFGFGPLGPLLRDPSVRDIYVYGPRQVHVFRPRTGLEGTDVRFNDEAHIQEVIERIFSQPGLSFSKKARVNTATLPNKTEVTVVSPSKQGALNETILIIRSPA